ncbi:hypothetical protein [Streptomyces sp. ATMOS53]|jgi:pyruvate dehydrogenase E1 component beta subunit
MGTSTKAATTTYREAMREALREALDADERVFLMGEDVGRYSGSFGVSLGLLEEFGPERLRDTPLTDGADFLLRCLCTDLPDTRHGRSPWSAT